MIELELWTKKCVATIMMIRPEVVSTLIVQFDLFFINAPYLMQGQLSIYRAQGRTSNTRGYNTLEQHWANIGTINLINY